MKTNIKISPSNPPSQYVWYSYDEFCDGCGKQIHYLDMFKTSEIPDVNKTGFCYECMCYALDNNIPKDKVIESLKARNSSK